MLESLTLLSFNVGLLKINLLGIPLLTPAPYIEDRLKAMPGHLLALNADIIALQEIYKQKHRDYLVKALKKTYKYWTYKKTNNPIGLNNGLMFFSKHPIEETKLTLFKNNTIDEKLFADKGILSISIHAGDIGRVRIYNTHTTAGGVLTHPESEKCNAIRQQQVDQLLHMARQDGCPSIIMGDLNAGPGVSEENYQSIVQNGFVDPAAESGDGANQEESITWDPQNPLNAEGPHRHCPPQKVDHIFVSEPLLQKLAAARTETVLTEPCVRKDGARFPLSDHYGQLLTLSSTH